MGTHTGAAAPVNGNHNLTLSKIALPTLKNAGRSHVIALMGLLHQLHPRYAHGLDSTAKHWVNLKTRDVTHAMQGSD
jgi:hypothetical protein